MVKHAYDINPARNDYMDLINQHELCRARDYCDQMCRSSQSSQEDYDEEEEPIQPLTKLLGWLHRTDDEVWSKDVAFKIGNELRNILDQLSPIDVKTFEKFPNARIFFNRLIGSGVFGDIRLWSESLLTLIIS